MFGWGKSMAMTLVEEGVALAGNPTRGTENGGP